MTVMITGASSGLGYELGKEFQNSGDNLVLLARKNSFQEKDKIFKKQKIISLDLLQANIQDEINTLFKQFLPDVIIHCAGSKLNGDEHPIDINLLNQSMNINVNNPISINNYFISKAKKQGKHLRIIHISSDAGLTGRASPSYSIAKGALNTYVKNSARIYKKNNIMICGILPSKFDKTNINEVVEIVKNIGKTKNMLYSAELITITAGTI